MSSGELPSSYDPVAAATRWSQAWAEADVDRADPARPGPAFSVVIPPPNVTGRLHMGHALNNTIQDVLVRYKRMDGFNVVWVPGTDHAGIATQWVVRRQLEAQGIDYRTLGREGFIEKVWAWKAETGGAIVSQLKRLGVSCDWSRERFTMDEALQKAVVEHFVRLHEQGLIYRAERLINWDPMDQTALSDLEVEYAKDARGQTKLEKGELFKFAYRFSDGSGEIVVATTRPETMLGDTAIAVHPDDERYKARIGQTVDHPFLDRKIPIVGDAILVDPAFGTGAVKVTPAHDFNDFAVGERHNLPKINILQPDGRLNDVAGPFAGLDRFEAREAVKAKLDELGLARGCDEHFLAIGRSQRSGAIVEPYLSTQWFVRMKPLAGPALAAVELGATKFHPKAWENLYYSWMRNIQDWCISRQLWWGHRIPAWTCDACGKIHVARQAPEACEGCGASALTQDPDTLDTWFSSALWPFSVFGWPDRTDDLDRYYPTSVLVTAFDIIFFWVARMMVAGIHFTGRPPFADVYIHALVRDENRQKMSKTKGNVVDPLDVIERTSADAFRFTLMLSCAQGRDILWDEKRVGDASRFVTKLWQALRYATMHAEGYDPSAPMAPSVYERWMEARTGAAVARVRDALDTYRFNDAAAEARAFVWDELCDWYIELTKPTLYREADPAHKNAVKHTLFQTLGAIARMLHPFMPMFTEELWHRLPSHAASGGGLVALAAYPKAEDFAIDAAVLDEVTWMQDTVTAVRNLRGEMELSPRVPLRLLVGDALLLARLGRHAGALEALAGVSLEAIAERPVGCATLVVRGAELLIPLEGVVDIAEELERLTKVIAKSAEDLDFLAKRLDNPDFIARAPADKVEELRDKVAAASARHEVLLRSQARLREAQ